MTSRFIGVLAYGLAIWVGSACEKREEPQAAALGSADSPAPPAPAAGDRAAGDRPRWRSDLQKVCELPSAAPEAVRRSLALSEDVTARAPSAFSSTHVKCIYSAGVLDVTIEVETGASSLASARRALERVAPPQDYPGFGDEACSITVPLGADAMHTLAVRKGDVVAVVSARAPLDKLRVLAAALLVEMGMAA